MTRLVIKSGAGRGLCLELKAGLNRVGRDEGNDVLIDDPTISGAHCEIEVREGMANIRDLASTNGTQVNGTRITEAQLTPGMRFKLGEVELSFENTPVVIAIPEVNFAEPSPPPLLEDGSIPCLQHAGVRASHKCSQCQRCFCADCLHHLRVEGGQMLNLCPVCSGRCLLLPGQADLAKKKSFFTRLRETLGLARKNN